MNIKTNLEILDVLKKQIEIFTQKRGAIEVTIDILHDIRRKEWKS